MNVIVVSPKGKPTEIHGTVIVPDHLTGQETFEAACREVNEDPAQFEFRELLAMPLDLETPQSFSVRNTRVELPAYAVE